MKEIFIINLGITTQVSDEDYLYTLSLRLRLDGKGYIAEAISNGWGTHLHILIAKRMSLDTKKYTIDHKNRLHFDNSRENLREATRTQQMQNRTINKNNICGYKGVYWYHGAWVSRIQVNDIAQYIGRFKTAEEAYAAYCEAANKYFGEFSSEK